MIAICSMLISQQELTNSIIQTAYAYMGLYLPSCWSCQVKRVIDICLFLFRNLSRPVVVVVGQVVAVGSKESGKYFSHFLPPVTVKHSGHIM